MAILTCERCGRQTAKMQVCNYCSKKICHYCIKSSKKLKKVKELYICKSCWSSMKARRRYKAA